MGLEVDLRKWDEDKLEDHKEMLDRCTVAAVGEVGFASVPVAANGAYAGLPPRLVRSGALARLRISSEEKKMGLFSYITRNLKSTVFVLFCEP